MPVAAVEQEVSRRYAELELPLTYEQLRDHVTARLVDADVRSIATALAGAPSIPRCCAQRTWILGSQMRMSSKHLTATPQTCDGTSNVRLNALGSPCSGEAAIMKPSFFERHLQCLATSKSRKQKTVAKRMRDLTGVLEQAAIYCALASGPFPKPLRTMLEEATAHCLRYDELKVLHQQCDEASKLSCARGGRIRHARNKPMRIVRRLAIMLLRSKAPAGKWKSRSEAADTIAVCLSKFVIKHKLKISCSIDARSQDILSQIKVDPRTNEAFRLNSCAKRTNRSKLSNH
jgi:hypothetical protein